MTIWQTIKSAFSFRWWLGEKKDHGDPMDWSWVNADFYTEEQRKTEKLADLARWIEGARRNMEKRRGQKKRFSHIEDAIRQAQNERLEIETGRRVYHAGAWVLKDEVNAYAKAS